MLRHQIIKRKKSLVIFFYPFFATHQICYNGAVVWCARNDRKNKYKTFFFLSLSFALYRVILIKEECGEVHRFFFCSWKFGFFFLESFIDCDNFHYSYVCRSKIYFDGKCTSHFSQQWATIVRAKDIFLFRGWGIFCWRQTHKIRNKYSKI